MRASACSILVVLLTGCATPGGPYPSLQPRAGEALDPRVAVDRPINDRPVAPGLASKLAALVSQAHAAEPGFDAAASQAERLAAAAGAPQSEGWIAAQEALSAAIAAGGPARVALGDLDALGASLIQQQGGLAPSDLSAIRIASADVGAIDQRQAARIDAVKRRLGT
jgi:hypothetical protein